MNTLRRLVPGLVLGLTIAVGGAVFAQSANQPATDKKESCCASCVCCDSCPTMKEDAMKNHATATDKHECCRADSCCTKHGAVKNGAGSDKHGCSCCGSCSMKNATTNTSASSDNDECCSESCNMKDHAKMNSVGMEQSTTASHHNGCCCCGDSCDLKDVKKKSVQ